MPDDMQALYERSFFEAQSFDSLRSGRAVLPDLFRYVRPRSVVDIGCGIGTWLRAAGDLGVEERLGVDGDYVDRDALMLPDEQFLSADLSKPGLADAVAAVRPGRFDLVMCLEVAEHLPFEHSKRFVEELCQLSDLVLFSAAIPFQYGTGHINEQWPEFWATHFRACGYACFDLLRPGIWERADVDWWYAQNLLVFARHGSAVSAELPAEAAAGVRVLAKVHPEAWLSGMLNIWHRQRAAARMEEPEDFRALVHAWVTGAGLCPPLRAVERARLAPPGAHDVFPVHPYGRWRSGVSAGRGGSQDHGSAYTLHRAPGRMRSDEYRPRTSARRDAEARQRARRAARYNRRTATRTRGIQRPT